MITVKDGNGAAVLLNSDLFNGGQTPRHSIEVNGAAVSAAAPFPVAMVPYVTTPLGYEQLATFSTAQTLSVPAGATIAVIAVSGNDCRYLDNGSTPTATGGMPLRVGEKLTYTGSLAALKFIPQAGTATLDVLFYK